MATSYQDPLRVGERLDYQVDWSAGNFLVNDTISGSTWSVTPGSGLAVEDEDNTTTTAVAFAEPASPGIYRLRNTITTGGGKTFSHDILIPVPGPAGALTYIGAPEASERLWALYGIESEIHPGDVEAATIELDDLAPFNGTRVADGQTLAWPRSYPPELEGAVPEAVLSWVALRAHELSAEDDPPLRSDGVGSVSSSYFRPKVSRSERIRASIMRPYLRRTGSVL